MAVPATMEVKKYIEETKIDGETIKDILENAGVNVVHQITTISQFLN